MIKSAATVLVLVGVTWHAQSGPSTPRPIIVTPDNFRDVPVDAFWSISVYNAEGHYQKNALNAYTVNNTMASKGADGSVTVQFGGCDGTMPNCLPIMKGWNYMVRLYRPRAEILNGNWTFPEAKPQRLR
jgi:hypothetical protein